MNNSKLNDIITAVFVNFVGKDKNGHPRFILGNSSKGLTMNGWIFVPKDAGAPDPKVLETAQSLKKGDRITVIGFFSNKGKGDISVNFSIKEIIVLPKPSDREPTAKELMEIMLTHTSVKAQQKALANLVASKEVSTEDSTVEVVKTDIEHTPFNG